jgi:hypothetical protein
MGEEPPQPNLELALAIGRVEEGVKGLRDKLDTIGTDQKKHSDTLTRHEVDIQVLKSRQQPRLHWVTILGVIVAIVVSAIALLDRLFTQ